jgi:hypothetical protein
VVNWALHILGMMNAMYVDKFNGVADFKYEFLSLLGALVAENKSLNYGLFEFHTSIQQRQFNVL